MWRVIGANVPGDGSRQVMAQPGNQPIDSNRHGYALIATGNFGASGPVPTNTSTSVDAASFTRAAAPSFILSRAAQALKYTSNIYSHSLQALQSQILNIRSETAISRTPGLTRE